MRAERISAAFPTLPFTAGIGKVERDTLGEEGLLVRMKRLYTGPFSAVYRNVWIAKAKRMASDDWLWLLPTRYLLHTVRQRLLTGQAGLTEVPLQTFDDVAKHLAEQDGRATRFVSEYVRVKIAQRLLEQHEGDPALAVFRPIAHQPGLAFSVARTIGEMKRYGFRQETVQTYLEDYRATAHEFPREYAIAHLFFLYQQELYRHDELLVDHEELLHIATERLRTVGDLAADPLVGRRVLWIDHFTDFTPLQMDLLCELTAAASEVGIYIPFPAQHEKDLPHLSAQLQETIHKLADLGVEHVPLDGLTTEEAMRRLQSDWLPEAEVKAEDEGAFFSSAALPLLEREQRTGEGWERSARTGHADELPPAPAGLSCLPACSPQREVEEVAKEIKRLVRLEGIPLNDIAIVVKDSQYEPLLHEVMRRDGIPLYTDERVPLHETTLVRQLLALLRLPGAGWEPRDVLSLAQGGYLRWQHQPPHGIETWVRQIGLTSESGDWRLACERDLARLQRLAQDQESSSLPEEERGKLLARLARQQEHVRRIAAWLNEVHRYVDDLAAATSWEERLAAVERVWQKLDISASIRRVWLDEIKRGELDGYCRDLLVFEALCSLLQEMKQQGVLYAQRITHSWSGLVSELREQISRKNVTARRGQVGGIRLFDPSAIRGASFAVVCVLGLNEGSFPAYNREDWLIRDAERVTLQFGQARLPASYAGDEMEQLFFEMATHPAREKLILSYVSPEVDEQVLRSRFLEQLQRRFAPGEWLAPERFSEALESRLFAAEREAVSSGQEYLNRALWHWGRAERETEVLRQDPLYHAERSALDRLTTHAAIERVRREGPYSRWDGHLQDPQIHARLRAEFSPDRTYSVSWIDDYAACPLHFFFARVLKVRQLEEAEEMLSPLETGNVLHEVLRRLLSAREGLFSEQSFDAWREMLHDVFRQVTAEWEAERQHVLSPLWPLEKQRLLSQLERWLVHEVERMGRGRFTPQHLEFAFGLPAGDGSDPQSVSEPIELSLGGETIRLVGRIDRIDRDRDGNFVLYDYKLSTARYKGCHNMAETTNFQLPLYALAYERLLIDKGEQGKAAGAGFYSLRPQDKFQLIGLWEKASLADLGLPPRTRAGVTEDVAEEAAQALVRIANFMAAIKSGRFYLLPEHEENTFYGNRALYRTERRIRDVKARKAREAREAEYRTAEVACAESTDETTERTTDTATDGQGDRQRKQVERGEARD